MTGANQTDRSNIQSAAKVCTDKAQGNNLACLPNQNHSGLPINNPALLRYLGQRNRENIINGLLSSQQISGQQTTPGQPKNQLPKEFST
jgi:hypothetical protein